MDALKTLLETPIFWKIVIGYWIFNAAVDSLPAPNGNKVYQFVYGFFHSLGGNVRRAAVGFRVPGAQ